MIIDFDLLLLTIVVLFIIVAVCLEWQKLRYIPLQKRVVRMMFLIYVLTIISITLFPIGADLPRSSEIRIRLVPLQDILKLFSNREGIYYIDLWINIAGNVLLFIPFGFLLPLLQKMTFIPIVILGFLISLTIEVVQLLMQLLISSPRTVSTDDIILNTIGVALGYIMLQAGTKALSSYRKATSE